MEEEIVRRLKLQNKQEIKRVVSLAKQYSRTIVSKSIKSQPIEHSHVCIDLALETVGAASVNKESLFKQSGTTKRCYQDTKRIYRNTLGLKDTSNNLKQIVIKYAPNVSAQYMLRQIQALKSKFEERFLKTVAEEKRAQVDFSRPVFAIVAFWLIAKQEKAKVAKQELIQEFDLKLSDFDNVKQQMQELCSDILQIKNSTTTTRKRKNENSGRTPSSSKKQKRVHQNEEVSDNDADGGDDENLPSHCINKKALKEKKYEQWKDESISNALKLNLVEQNTRKKKQATITSFMKPSSKQVEAIEDGPADDVQNENLQH